MTPDFEITDHGSIVLVCPVSQAAKAWVAFNLPDDAQWWGRSVAVEARYALDVVGAIIDDGFSVN